MNDDDAKAIQNFIEMLDDNDWMKGYSGVETIRAIRPVVERLTAELKETKQDYDEKDEYLYEVNYRLEKALKKAGESPDPLDNLGPRVDDVCRVLETIPQLKAENARLTAEVERLTPKPLDCFQICDIFNAHAFGGRSDWVLISEGDEPFRIGSGSGFGYFKDDAAVYIAQGLLRDAGPSDAREPRGGGTDD